jgi:hypothetical protein
MAENCDHILSTVQHEAFLGVGKRSFNGQQDHSCSELLSTSSHSRRFVHKASDATRSETLCTPGSQPCELVQSPSENDKLATRFLATLFVLFGR